MSDEVHQASARKRSLSSPSILNKSVLDKRVAPSQTFEGNPTIRVGP
jgi:hypothetical protein